MNRSSLLLRSGAAAALSFSLISPAFAAGFSDIASSDNRTAIEYLSDHGVIAGYADGTFRPDGSINRAELLKILVGATGARPGVDGFHDCFTDVTNEWYAPYACYAKAQGWVQGYADGSFRPGNPVNTAESIKMILGTQGIAATPGRGSNGEIEDDTEGVEDVSPEDPYTDVDGSAWYAGYVETASAKNLLFKASGRLGIGDDMTRGLVAESIYRAMSIKESGADHFGASQSSSSSSSSTSSSSAMSSSSTAVDPKKKYADGTYRADGTYWSPAGSELVTVTLTLKDDIITAATFKASSTNGLSRTYQGLFAQGYTELVVGQPIDTLSLGVVNGSSLTPNGFMDAVAAIKLQAKA